MSLRGTLSRSFISSTALTIGAMFGGCHNGQTTWNYLPDLAQKTPSETPVSGQYSIFVGSLALVDVPVLDHGDPVHHFIRAFDSSRGFYEGFLMLDGVSTCRDTGDVVFNGDALFARLWAENAMTRHVGVPRAPMPPPPLVPEKIPIPDAAPTATTTTAKPEPPKPEKPPKPEVNRVRELTEIYEGPPEDVLRKLIIMADAANFMNEQNLVYQLLGVLREGQNSNSFVNSMLHAAGLEIPPQNRAYFDPGSKRLLLPENFRSHYNDWQPPVTGQLFLTWYLGEMLAQLDANCGYNDNTENADFVAAAYAPPPRGRRVFFDPKAPFAPYQPLMIEDAAARFAVFEAEYRRRHGLPELTPQPSTPETAPAPAPGV
jgi:hypothetical protein